MARILQPGIQSWWIVSITLSLVGMVIALSLGSHPSFAEPRWGSLASGIAIFQTLNVCFAVANLVYGSSARRSRPLLKLSLISLVVVTLAVVVLWIEVRWLGLVG